MRRIAALLAATTALTLALAGTATPEGVIEIEGAAGGTHLRLSVAGGQLNVTGPMAAIGAGCSFTRGHGASSCSLTGAGAIEVQTGPADDKVEVLGTLPAPLTVYLGGGSDKMIGGGEPDSCHPQGSDRNRCIGGGGNDLCVSGPVNTDCVGGPGEDVCKTSDGSDGCWGGPGDDVCTMGGGSDGCHGEGGNDRLYGGPGADQLYGGPGYDYCDGGPGRGKSHECEAGPQR